MWLDCTINYWDDDLDCPYPKMKNFHRHILIQAYSYTDGEAKATEWACKEIGVGFEISPIKELNISDYIKLVDRNEKDRLFHFQCDCVFYSERTNGTLKSNKYSMMIEEYSPERASVLANKYMKDMSNRTDCSVNKVTRTLIETTLFDCPD